MAKTKTTALLSGMIAVVTRARRRARCVPAVLVLAGMAVAGCGASSSSSQTAADAATPLAAAPASPASSACVFGANGADVEVQVTGDSDCNSWIQALAGDGLTWQPISSLMTPGAVAADGDTMGLTCVLDNGPEQITVEDAGSGIYGNDICNSEEQSAWTPDTSAEASDQASAEQAQASQAAAQASASSAAALASQQAQVPEDDQAVNSGAATIASDLATYDNDVKAAKAALSTVQGEPSCSDGTSDQTTYDDAQNVYDDGQTIYDDEDALASDVQTAADPVAQLQADLKASGETKDSALARVDVDLAEVNSIAPNNHTESSAIQNAAEAVQNKTYSC